MEGEAEADHSLMFYKGLPEGMPDERKFEMWHILRQLDQIRLLSNTNSHMYALHSLWHDVDG